MPLSRVSSRGRAACPAYFREDGKKLPRGRDRRRVQGQGVGLGLQTEPSSIPAQEPKG